MAGRKIEEGSQKWELKNYVWRGKGEKSALTGKQVRPVVALDTNGKYHAGLRNWSYYSNGRPGDALYHHAACGSRAEAITRANGMCSEWASAHREVKADMKRCQSAAAKYGTASRSAPGKSHNLRH